MNLCHDIKCSPTQAANKRRRYFILFTTFVLKFKATVEFYNIFLSRGSRSGLEIWTGEKAHFRDWANFLLCFGLDKDPIWCKNPDLESGSDTNTDPGNKRDEQILRFEELNECFKACVRTFDAVEELCCNFDPKYSYLVFRGSDSNLPRMMDPNPDSVNGSESLLFSNILMSKFLTTNRIRVH